MKRALLRGLLAIGLLLSIAAWLVSEFRFIGYTWSGSHMRHYLVDFCQGSVRFGYSDLVMGGLPPPGLDVLVVGADHGVSRSPRKWLPVVSTSFGVIVELPLWIPTAALAAPLPMSVWRGRRRAGCCAHCGYDLRPTPAGPCPECGHTCKRP